MRFEWTPAHCHSGFKSFKKKRSKHGNVYYIDVGGMVREMVEKKWILDDELPPTPAFLPC